MDILKMKTLIRMLFSVPAEKAADSDIWYFRFLSPWDIMIAVPGAAVLLLLVILTYFRQPERMPRWIKAACSILRFTAAAGIIVMLWRPALTFEKIIEEKPYLIIIADKSMSMDIKDIPGENGNITRDKAVSRLCSRISESADLDKFNVGVFAVGEKVQKTSLNEIETIPADQHRSRIYALSMTILRRYAGKPVAGAFIFTDGNNTGGSADESDFNRFLAEDFRSGICSIIGTGSRSVTVDVEAEELIAPRNVLMKETIEVIFRYSVQGALHSALTVVLKENGLETARKEIPPDSRKGIVSFTYRPQSQGDILLSAQALPAEGEAIQGNNSVSQMITVYRGTLKILYIEGSPRWEYRYLKNSMVRDKMVSLSILLLSADPGFGREGSIPIASFPDADGLAEYDTIIIGDVPASFFSDRQMLDVAECVEKKGTGVVWIPGNAETASSYINTPIADILPVTLLKTEVYSVFEEERKHHAFKPKILPAALDHPVMQLADERDTNESIWSSLPSFYHFIPTQGIRPGKTLLAEYPSRFRHDRKEVVFAAGFFGIGKCFFSAVDSTWRWRFRAGDIYFYRFWMNVFRYVSSGRFAEGREPCFIITDSSSHVIGKQVSLTALIRDKDFNPVSAPEWEAEIEYPGHSRKSILLKPVPGSRGYFSGKFYPAVQGVYTIRAKDAEGIRRQYMKIKVGIPKGEITHVLMNIRGMKNALGTSEGELLQIEESGKILNRITGIRGQGREDIIKSDIEIFNHWILFVLIAGTITAEWILRKAYKLA